MAELINNLRYKTYKQIEEALVELSMDDNNSKKFIDINGSMYLIPKEVHSLIEALYSQVEKLELKENGL